MKASACRRAALAADGRTGMKLRYCADMSVIRTPRLVASHEQLQREFDRAQAAAAADDDSGYESRTAQWLTGQVPGADLEQLGWAIILVCATLYPDVPAAPTTSSTRPPPPP